MKYLNTGLGIALAVIILCGLATGLSRLNRHVNAPHHIASPIAISPTNDRVSVRKSSSLPSRAIVAHAKQTPVTATLAAVYPDIKNPVEWKAFNRSAQKITVCPFPGAALSFEMTAVKDEGSCVTWFGTNKDIPGSTLIAVASPWGVYDSLLIMPGADQFSFHTDSNGRTFSTNVDPGAESCAVGGQTQPARAPRTITLTAATYVGQYTAAAQALKVANPDIAVRGAPAAISDTTILVNVLFAYDADCLNTTPDPYYGGGLLWGSTPPADIPAYIDGLARTYIAAANVVLNNSGVTNFQWNYVGAIQCQAYSRPANSDIAFDLAEIQNGPTSNWLNTQCNTFGANQVVFWRGRQDGVISSGLAGAGAGVPPLTANYSRAVTIFGASYRTVLHEMAHNFGCNHNRASLGYTPTTDRYDFGQIWKLPDTTTVYTVPAGSTRQDYSNGNVTFTLPNGSYVYTWSRDMGYASAVISAPESDGSITVTNTTYNTAGTIMSYASNIIPYFSNPSITIDVSVPAGSSIVDWGTHALGFPAGHPLAAYNAKVLSDNAAAMANLNSINPRPMITEQPLSVTVQAGQYFYMGVTCLSGDLLTYQWYKGNTAIGEANPYETYYKSAEASDAGNYHVVITNYAGSTTSMDATVTVTSAPVPPSIWHQPQDAMIRTGRSFTFSVNAFGGTLSYQWRKDGLAISGATDSTYSISSTSSGDTGNYTVVATSSNGATTSNPARLSVIDPPSDAIITITVE